MLPKKFMIVTSDSESNSHKAQHNTRDPKKKEKGKINISTQIYSTSNTTLLYIACVVF